MGADQHSCSSTTAPRLTLAVVLGLGIGGGEPPLRQLNLAGTGAVLDGRMGGTGQGEGRTGRIGQAGGCDGL